MSENDDGDLRIEIERIGPGPEVVDEVSRDVLDHPSVREYLSGTRYRLLSVQLLDAAVEGKPEEPMPPDRYRATIYDYTNNRVVLATGRLDDIEGSMSLSQEGRLRRWGLSCTATMFAPPTTLAASYVALP